MNFDINEVLFQMTDAIKQNVAENWDEVKTPANNFLQNRKERYTLLADLLINNEISQPRFDSRMEDEKLIAEAEFHAIAVISKAIAQKAANAAIDIFQNAVKAAITVAT
ncbi:hypothetical protein [Aquiflexum gelatinilyticum]|uniref:Uncharacterized protein n=1 Tax=Aquiflexum gelatinilyticum TaxID=2961943 RepID=A0A9X2T3Y2_9BACT|nr:hypothetical protein [Aquiflexum gelatinilyticum]MCR9016940.1 hypothetical protein [Aquiflexum gelatinilyticum]